MTLQTKFMSSGIKILRFPHYWHICSRPLANVLVTRLTRYRLNHVTGIHFRCTKDVPITSIYCTWKSWGNQNCDTKLKLTRSSVSWTATHHINTTSHLANGVRAASANTLKTFSTGYCFPYELRIERFIDRPTQVVSVPS